MMTAGLLCDYLHEMGPLCVDALNGEKSNKSNRQMFPITDLPGQDGSGHGISGVDS